MKYPAWFPYPNSWLRAIILLISFIPICVICGVVFKICGVSLFLPLMILEDKIPQGILVAVIILALSLGALFPIYLLANLDKMLWGKSKANFPAWFPPPKSWLEGFISLLIFLLAIFFTVVLFVDFIDLNESNTYYSTYSSKEVPAGAMTITWTILSAYMYQLRHFIFQKLGK